MEQMLRAAPCILSVFESPFAPPPGFLRGLEAVFDKAVRRVEKCRDAHLAWVESNHAPQFSPAYLDTRDAMMEACKLLYSC